jgi:kinesin family protein 22
MVDLTSYEQFEKEHTIAWKERITAATKLNENSSRSHFILQMIVETTHGKSILQSKLNICDLAGSEDNKRTGNQGQRMKESATINKSLFCLGQVVEAIQTNQSRIPYRDSKLTRLLQDALGGTAIGVVSYTHEDVAM